jgi:hypothetical protein
MLPIRAAIACLAASAAAGCSPTLNWREVRVEPTALLAMLPCKPDKGARRVPMAGAEVELSVLGCDTGGATFAILHARIADPGRSAEVLAQWNAASLANMKSSDAATRPFVPAGAMPLASSVRVTARGQRTDGSAVSGEAAYFAHGGHVFQAVVYADQPQAQVLQPFFEGLKFR